MLIFPMLIIVVSIWLKIESISNYSDAENILSSEIITYFSDFSFKVSNQWTFTNSTSKIKRGITARKKARRNNCRLIDFYVNFEDLGWNKWIIYPKSFNAYVCSGSCSLPLISRQGRLAKSKIQITNHAQIMSILELKNHPRTIKQMTKCVSTKLRPLNVMFLDDRGFLKTKRYDDMIVEECGCR